MAQTQETIQISCYQNQRVVEMRPLLDEWGIRLFREFPYLYVFQDETDYNTIFEVDPQAFVLFAEINGQKIGVIQANPLNSPFLAQELYTPSERLDQIKQNGFDPEQMLYISCFLMLPEERMNQEAINLLFDQAMAMAKTMGKKQICYMEIVYEPDHALKPASYKPLEPWCDLGINFKPMGVQVEMSWPTLQPDSCVKQEAHVLALYYMDLP